MVTEAVIQDVIGNVIEDIAGGLVAPPILATATAWFDETTLQISGSDVTGWANKGLGGAVYDYIARSNGANLPQVGVFNGKSIADLTLLPDGNRKYFTPAVGTLVVQPMSFFTVAKLDVLPAAQATLFDSLTGNPQVTAYGDLGTDGFAFGAGDTIFSGAGTLGLGVHVFHGIANGVTLGEFFISDIGSFGPGNTGLNDHTHGTLGANLNLFQTWDGWIGEQILIPSALTNQESADVIAYLRAKWGF